MKSLKKITTLLLLVGTTKCFAQNKFTDYRAAISVSNAPSVREVMYYPYKNINTFDKQVRFLNPAIAVQLKTKRNNFKEIELTSFSFNKHDSRIVSYPDSTHKNPVTIGGYVTYNLNLSLSLEYIKMYRKTKDKKLVPAIGFGTMPYIYHSINNPVVSFLFRTATTSVGFSAYVCPRIYYYFNNRLFLNINVPIAVLGFEFQNQKTNNPFIAKNNRSVTTLNFDTFRPHFYPRIGVGFKL